MKSFIVLAVVVAAALAAPANSDADAQVLNYESDNIGVDGFKYEFQTSNGIQQSEQGTLQNAGTDDEGIEVRGQYSYVGPDGVTYSVEYSGGKDGFQAKGAHIPV